MCRERLRKKLVEARQTINALRPCATCFGTGCESCAGPVWIEGDACICCGLTAGADYPSEPSVIRRDDGQPRCSGCYKRWGGGVKRETWGCDA